MTADKIRVQVAADQFERLARPTRPIAGIEELIWNGLDAEATRVEVIIERSGIGAVETVLVQDDGHGMSYDEVMKSFSVLGGSWKKEQVNTKNGVRQLHGKKGEGRFRAFAIGREVTWTSYCRHDDGRIYEITVTGSLNAQEFEISESVPVTSPESTGTLVAIKVPQEYAFRLLADNTPTLLISRFANYLARYAHLEIWYDNSALELESIVSKRSNLVLDLEQTHDEGPIDVELIEWTENISNSIILCSEGGVAMHELVDNLPEIHNVSYTVYVTWSGFEQYQNDLDLCDMGHPVLHPIVAATRKAIEAHIESEKPARRQAIIEKWREDKVYPFSGAPSNYVQTLERQVFDAVAIAATSSLPTDKRATRLSLRLIKEALENNPGSLHQVLEEVLDLTPNQIDDFAAILKNAPLVDIIATTKVVTDRLLFLDHLESLLFDVDKKPKLKERTQLHRILADQSWTFGERFYLAVSDRGLTKVLEAHQELIGNETVIDEPVLDIEGHVRIVDLMLSRAVHEHGGRKHLVVELKRPSVTLSLSDCLQVVNYATSIASDERFASDDVQWEFWLLGNAVDENVRQHSHQAGQPPGMYSAPENQNYRIWVKQWADLLEENRQRHHFYRENLSFYSDADSAFEDILKRYIPE